MYRTLGVCGGNGVILHPFKGHLIANIEPRSKFHTGYEYQWRLNFDVPLYRELQSRKRIGEVDVIVGAPDCGHSSVLSYSRKKSLSNPKENESLQIYIKSIHKYKPKIFSLENLPAFLQNYGEDDLRRTFSNYRLVFHCCSVSRFGNSQVSRKRLLIIGVRVDLGRKILKKFKLPREGRYELKTSGELLRGLIYPNEKLCHVRENLDQVITLYAGKKLGLTHIKRVWTTALQFSKRWKVVDGNFSNAPGVYKNLAHEYPLTARPANRQFNHMGEMMSARELGRIQGIPDSFNLWYDKGKSQYCINKARVTVAKSTPYEIGIWLYKRINKIYKQQLIK